MTAVFRYLTYGTYPLLALSICLFLGLQFGAGFRADFEISNGSNVAILVTPIGVGQSSKMRRPLPVTSLKFIHFPALKNGQFPLAPGDSIRIHYDADDFQLSEIFVDAGPTKKLELIVDPDAALHCCSAPEQDRFVIRDLSKLATAKVSVQVAANSANKNGSKVYYISSMLLGPWLIFVLVSVASFAWNRWFVPIRQASAEITYPSILISPVSSQTNSSPAAPKSLQSESVFPSPDR